MAVNPTLAMDETRGSLFPLPQSGEAFVLKRDGIDFECTLPQGSKLWARRGSFFLSSTRIVFVSGKSTCRADFKSFEMPLGTMQDYKFNQPIFGANYLSGTITPVDLSDTSSPLVGGRTSFSLTFNSGGCGTFLPLYFRLLSEAQERSGNASLAEAAQAGRLQQEVAFVDPSDPSVLYLSQPTAAPNSQESTPFDMAPASAPPQDGTPGSRAPASQGQQHGGGAHDAQTCLIS